MLQVRKCVIVGASASGRGPFAALCSGEKGILGEKNGGPRMLDELRDAVYEANIDLVRHGLVVLTWGNASGCDRERELFVIKPSGVAYDKLTPEDLVVCDFDGKVVEGSLRPSTDTPTHAYLYKMWDSIGGVVHTHSSAAVSWAQAGRSIPCYGATHADYFYGELPCMRALTSREIDEGYEINTGRVIVKGFEKLDLDPLMMPGVLVRGHGPFSWGEDAAHAVYHAAVLEEIAKTALNTELLSPSVGTVPQYLLDKHYLRKHGHNAYYGQAGA